jgi:hypothetical protein
MCTCGVRAPDRRSPPLPRPLPLPHPPPLPPPLPAPLPKQRSVPSSLPRPPCVPGAPSPGASSVVGQRGARAFLERRARPRSLAPVCGQERRAHGREAARERQHKRGRERAKAARERGSAACRTRFLFRRPLLFLILSSSVRVESQRDSSDEGEGARERGGASGRHEHERGSTRERGRFQGRGSALSLEVLVEAPPLVLELVGQHVRRVLGVALAEGEGRHVWALHAGFIARAASRSSSRSRMML